jgi:glycosyltransferase involved in cell wall biosynthesis
VVEAGSLDRPVEPLVDAMAAGRPVIAAAVGGVPELVRDGVSGLLVPPGDQVALAGALRQLADAGRRTAMAAEAMQLAGERHDPGLVGSAMLEVYRDAVGGEVGTESATAWRRMSASRSIRRSPTSQHLDSGGGRSSSPGP